MAKTNEILQDATKEPVIIKPNRIVVHDSYNPSTSKVANDIALIKLEQEVEWSDFVKPVCLPKPDGETYSGFSGTVAGWGFTNEISNGKQRKTLFYKQTFAWG